MRSLLIKRLMLVIAVGLIFTSAFLWFATPQKSTGFASAAVAAPGAGQKKVVLKNLRMA